MLSPKPASPRIHPSTSPIAPPSCRARGFINGSHCKEFAAARSVLAAGAFRAVAAVSRNARLLR